ncbi:MAG: nucleotidyltransferase domain-containing protein, partial [Oscillospiraceae bacterium]|nr:nucleotidyltransferase domain-containing protein [Oscillospiraceae bacterium]
YDFLRENEHLKDRIMILTLGGSYAYGTNTENSDIDIRGCAMNSPSDILGLTAFEQFIDSTTDTTVYSFNKLVRLLLNCNPNTIELLGCRPEHYFYLSDAGREMLENRKLFLSQRAVRSFGGYATQQLRRLENALARDVLPQAKKEEHLLHSMQRAQEDIENRYLDVSGGSIRLYTEESGREDLDMEVFADIQLVHLPARSFGSIINEFKNVLDTYDKSGKRNHKKDNDHLNKHAMHLIRLYLVCLDILEKGEIVTYREKELPLLRSIRAGEFQKEDGSYRREFFDMVTEFERKLEYARTNTSIPEAPNFHKIQEFVMDVNGRSI